MNAQTQPKPLSIHAFATVTGTDHRTVKRRIVANGIRPVAKAGRYAAYDFLTLQRLMADDQGCRHTAPPRPNAPESVIGAFETAWCLSVDAVGATLPSELESVLSRAGIPLTQAQADKITLDLWLGLMKAIDRALDHDYRDLCGLSTIGGTAEDIKEEAYPAEIGAIIKRIGLPTH